MKHVCIQSGYVLDDTKRPKNYSEQQYLCSAETMQERFKDLPEALVNTVEIAMLLFRVVIRPAKFASLSCS